jgi:hypothetical protein
VVVAVALAGCRTGAPEGPAVLVSPTAASRAALAEAVGGALGTPPVRLADDALTRSSTLIVDRQARRDPRGLPITGRDTGRPERFSLLKQGDSCILVHEKDGKRVTLPPSLTCAWASSTAP